MRHHSEIWILGATGRCGSAIAVDLAKRGLPLVLVGRSHERLDAVAAGLAGPARVAVAPSLEDTLEALQKSDARVVVNTIGPFGETALPVLRASPGSHYVDLSNELFATTGVLALHDEAVAAQRTLVSGAGWGVLGTESVTLKLCEGRPAAARVRVDMIPTIAVEKAEPLGDALAASIVDGIAAGGRRYEGGQLVPAGLGAEPLELTLPDGSKAKTGSSPTAELEAARRASGAAVVTAASSMAPTGRGARVLLPVVRGLLRWRGLRNLMTRRLARLAPPPPKSRREHSWAHARVQWLDGSAREGWLRAPEAMIFTTRVAAEVTARLATGQGRPGAFTPGALFGPALAVAAGGEFLEETSRSSE